MAISWQASKNSGVMKLAEITDFIGFMEKSEFLRLVFDSLASDTALTMAGISFFLTGTETSAPTETSLEVK